MINKQRLGLVFGTFLGAWHFVWAVLVLSGIAQPLMNLIFRLHFIEPPYTILPFDFGVAATLILVTSMTGYVSGWMLAAISNWLRAETSSLGSTPAVHRRQPAIRH
ncbi:MAG TPA: hypothetical protein VJU84_01115 [Pyrinomonadaceae bacterium]|nr:hypothetical protein [Pyrinomonadaceae bacterium]